jgi:hypothetical protein
MVVRLQKDQFTAGDMVIAVRSRRRAKPTAGFYGAGASEMKRVIIGGTTMNPTSKVVRVSETVSDKGMQFKESDDYFDTEPAVEEEQSLEQQVREEAQDALTERAKQILKEIEEDMKQINLRRSY